MEILLALIGLAGVGVAAVEFISTQSWFAFQAGLLSVLLLGIAEVIRLLGRIAQQGAKAEKEKAALSAKIAKFDRAA